MVVLIIIMQAVNTNMMVTSSGIFVNNHYLDYAAMYKLGFYLQISSPKENELVIVYLLSVENL